MKTALVIFAGLLAAVYGAEPCLRPCPRNLNPVCASFTKTYSNECEMKADACSLAEKGFHLLTNTQTACQCKQACPKNLWPVCASDGQTYDNECLMSAAACTQGKWLEVVSEGSCPEANTNN